jgi:protein-L-isoaspartate(D-aspartate) O-methyltransferase
MGIMDPTGNTSLWHRIAGRRGDGNPVADDPSAQERDRMIHAIEQSARELSIHTGSVSLDPRVMSAMAEVPRHVFVPDAQRAAAYLNHALPIGRGQTISQPFIVALMSDLLRVGPEDSVLEVGTGSGYQSAVLARLVKQVHSVETIPELAAEARGRLARLGCANVDVHTGNGAQGLPALAPFDGIMVTAAAREIPQCLVDQLKPSRHMVLPVGPPHETQALEVVHKDAQGRVEVHPVIAVAFVPLT